LQRDGLILLSWARRRTERGPRYTAYWVTSAGPARYYASGEMEEGRLGEAAPARKSCGARDGKEFHEQPDPEYVVHAAPALLPGSGPATGALREEHIRKLRAQGSAADSGCKRLLTAERKRKPGKA